MDPSLEQHKRTLVVEAARQLLAAKVYGLACAVWVCMGLHGAA